MSASWSSLSVIHYFVFAAFAFEMFLGSFVYDSKGRRPSPPLPLLFRALG